MNGFRYLVVGLDYKVAGGTMGEPECGQPICPMAIPVKPTVELQPQYAPHGFETIQTARRGSRVPSGVWNFLLTKPRDFG